MKIKLTKAEFEAEPAHVQALAVASGDGYTFDTAAVEDVTALKNAKKAAADEAKAAKQEAARVKAELETAQTELTEFQELSKTNVPKANLDALEKSYKAKLDKATADAAAEKTRLENSLGKHLVDSVANSLAGEISTAPKILLPHIASRLAVGFDAEGNAVTKVLDADGKPSALTVDDFRKEIVANKDYAAIIKAGNGSGGGASGGSAGGGAPGANGKPNMGTASATDIAAWLKTSGQLPTGGE